MLHLHRAYVRLPSSSTPISLRISESSKYTPFFDDCIGALDGTHHTMYVPEAEHSTYRNRKGTLSQNVLAACSLDGYFVFVLPGWEGSVHDSRVLQDATYNHGFVTPKGKYWLADAGYTNSEFVMVPYRGVRYHLKEQQQARLRSLFLPCYKLC
jgi:hypothetical protein